MPVIYQIDVPNRVIHTVCSGPLTVADVVDHFRVLEQDQSCPNRLDVVLEVRPGTTVPTTENLREVTRGIAGIRDRVEFGACAIVAEPDLLFGMMRMFEVFAEDCFTETRAFRTAGEAEVWLASRRQARGASSPVCK